MRPHLFPLFLLSLCFGLWSSCKHSTIAEAYPLRDVHPILKTADSLWKVEQFDDALIQYQQTLPLLRSQDDSLYRWLVVNWRIAVILSAEQQKRSESLLSIQAAKDTLLTWRAVKTKEEQRRLAKIYVWEAFVRREIGDLSGQKIAIEEAEAIYRKHLYGESNDIAWFLFSEMANLYVRLGEFENADRLFQESIEYEKKYAQQGIASYNDYGSTYLSQENYTKALGIFDAGLAAGFVDTFTQTMLLLNRAEALARLGQLKASEKSNMDAVRLLANKDNYEQEGYARCMRGLLENKAIIAEQRQDWVVAARQ